MLAITFSDMLSSLWAFAGRNLLGCFFRMVGWSLLGLALGILALVVFFKIKKAGWLEHTPGVDRWLHPLLTVFWVLGLPVLGLASGVTVGFASSAAYVIHHDHLGEQAGRAAFRALFMATVAASEQKSSATMSEWNTPKA